MSAYLDAELSPVEEMGFELHLAGCANCLDELNRQKEFLHMLDSTLKTDEIELPENFTKVVVTNAESAVKGLRRRSEWLNAMFVCSALLFFGLFALGADALRSFVYPMTVFDRVVAVAGFFGHLAYDVAIGTVVIVRSLTCQLANSTDSLVAVFAALVLAVVVIARQIQRHYRM